MPQAPTYGDLRLTIEDIPSVVALGQTFTFTCRVHNARSVRRTDARTNCLMGGRDDVEILYVHTNSTELCSLAHKSIV